MVCCFGRVDLFLPLCPDGRRYKLRDCAFMNKAAAGGGVCTGWGLRKFGSCYPGFCFYKPINDPLLPFQVPCRTCHVLGLLSPCYYWREAWGHVPWPSCGEDRTRPLWIRHLRIRRLSQLGRSPKLQNPLK